LAHVDERQQLPECTYFAALGEEDGNPYYSAFSTEQEPASLASKKRWMTLCVHSVSEIHPLWAG